MNFKHQRGLSLIGFIFIAAIVAFVMFTAFRCVPSLDGYFALKKVLQQVANEFGVDAQPPAIRASFDRRAVIDDLPVRGKGMEFGRTTGGSRLSIAYQRQVPVVGNMSLLFDFDASATGNR